MYRRVGQIVAAITLAPIAIGVLIIIVGTVFSCNQAGVISKCSNDYVVAPLATIVYWENYVGIVVIEYGVICMLVWALIGALRELHKVGSQNGYINSVTLVLLVALMVAETHTICNSGSRIFSVIQTAFLFLGPLAIVALALIKKNSPIPVLSACLAVLVGSYILVAYHTSHDPSKGMLTIISFVAYWVSGFLAFISLLQKSPNSSFKRDAAQKRGVP